jgi:cbb3-type cytochrome oxidase maturation protein
VRSGQLDDLETPAHRIFGEDDTRSTKETEDKPNADA